MQKECSENIFLNDEYLRALRDLLILKRPSTIYVFVMWPSCNNKYYEKTTFCVIFNITSEWSLYVFINEKFFSSHFHYFIIIMLYQMNFVSRFLTLDYFFKPRGITKDRQEFILSFGVMGGKKGGIKFFQMGNAGKKK